MKTPRKKICFNTPKRTYNKKAKTNNTVTTVHQESSETPHSELPSLNKKKQPKAKNKNIESEIKESEVNLIEAYKEENQALREINSDILLFKKFYGLEINKVSDDKYEFTQKIENKFIKFILEEEDENYSYKLIDFSNLSLPSYLMERIAFKKNEVLRFFFKVFEVILSKCKIN